MFSIADRPGSLQSFVVHDAKVPGIPLGKTRSESVMEHAKWKTVRRKRSSVLHSCTATLAGDSCFNIKENSAIEDSVKCLHLQPRYNGHILSSTDRQIGFLPQLGIRKEKGLRELFYGENSHGPPPKVTMGASPSLSFMPEKIVENCNVAGGQGGCPSAIICALDRKAVEKSRSARKAGSSGYLHTDEALPRFQKLKPQYLRR
ncbi:hypothetical protein Aduo_003771 [Ancylostoma duodenale]